MSFVRFLFRLCFLLVWFVVGVFIVTLGSLLPGEHQTKGTPAVRACRFWCRHFLRLIGIKVRVHGERPAAGAFYVANHISWLDIILCLSAFPVRFVSKREVSYWPIIGFIGYRIDTVFHNRGGLGAANETAAKMTEKLLSGKSMLVFPEGRTTTGETIRAFHARLYQATIDAKAPIQPVAINYRSHKGNPCPVIPYVGGINLLINLVQVMSLKKVRADIVVCPVIAQVDAPRKALANESKVAVQHALTELRQHSLPKK